MTKDEGVGLISCRKCHALKTANSKFTEVLNQDLSFYISLGYPCGTTQLHWVFWVFSPGTPPLPKLSVVSECVCYCALHWVGTLSSVLNCSCSLSIYPELIEVPW